MMLCFFYKIELLKDHHGIYVFNFADIAITASVICSILFLNKQTKESQRVLIPIPDELNSGQKKY